MPRRNNELPELEFLIRFGTRPFSSPNWAVGFMVVGAAFTICHTVFVGDPAVGKLDNPFEELKRQLQVIFWFRFMVPAVLFSTIGAVGGITCVVREWLAHSSVKQPWE